MARDIHRLGRLRAALRGATAWTQRNAVISIAAAAIVSSIAGGGMTYAAMTVHDPTAQAERILAHNTTKEQLEKDIQQLLELTDLTSVTGSMGASGLSGVREVTQQASRMGCRITNFESWGLAEDFDIPRLTSICDAASFVREALSAEGEEDEATGLLPAEKRVEIQARRDLVAEEAGLQGVALGLSEREAGTDAAGQLAALASSAEMSQTLRAEAAMNNRLQIRLIEEMVALRAIMASLLEVQSAQALRSVSTNAVIRGSRAATPNELRGSGLGSDDPFADITE